MGESVAEPGSGLSLAETMAGRLKALFAGRNYAAIDPPMLLPADIVLDRLGEDIRRRLLLVTAPDGKDLCLRPDFTLPVARAYLETAPNTVGRYAYAGLAFRFPAHGEQTRDSAQFHQAGIEHFGDCDAEAADAEVLAACVAALAEIGLPDIELTLGDVAMFNSLVGALNLGAGWEKRLNGEFRRHEFAKDMMQVFAQSPGGAVRPRPDAALAAALAGMNVAAARAVVEEVMVIAGTAQVGGRTPAEIAERFVEQARLHQDGAIERASFSTLERYLSLIGPVRKIVPELREIASFASRLGPTVDQFEHRLDVLEAAGVDLAKTTFSTGFSGRIEYYTGMVFDIRCSGNISLGPIASGGRYDRFLAEMGAPAPVAAVGGSVYVDRLIAALKMSP